MQCSYGLTVKIFIGRVTQQEGVESMYEGRISWISTVFGASVNVSATFLSATWVLAASSGTLLSSIKVGFWTSGLLCYVACSVVSSAESRGEKRIVLKKRRCKISLIMDMSCIKMRL